MNERIAFYHEDPYDPHFGLVIYTSLKGRNALID